MCVRVCRAVIPGIFEEERWIRREISRGSFFATVDVSVRVWVRDYERDFDRVLSCFANEGFCFGGSFTTTTTKRTTKRKRNKKRMRRMGRKRLALARTQR